MRHSILISNSQMIIPQFWAEAQLHYRSRQRRDARIKRWGWSDTPQADAQQMAQQRCQQALQQKNADPSTPWRERKRAYNGADGMPIREEVLQRNGDFVITRNAYGAHCLNSPDVLFVDVDFAPPSRSLLATWEWILGFATGAALFQLTNTPLKDTSGSYILLCLLLGVLSIAILGMVRRSIWHRAYARKEVAFYEQAADACVQKVKQHSQQHPEWNWRVYRTPHGMRLLATHQRFDPRSATVQNCFDYFDADPTYTRMCSLQNCFRARVSPKPWRMGMAAMQPRGVWPISTVQLPPRQAWACAYEKKAAQFAACRFVCEVGSGNTDAIVRHTLHAHDDHAQALTQLPLA